MIVNYEEGPVFYNVENPLGRRESVPKTGGLYLIGNTIFNPLSNEQFFLIKIGMSTNLYDRMKGYSTDNPMLFHIGYKLIINDTDSAHLPRYKARNVYSQKIKAIEEQYHQQMKALNFCRHEYADEWFMVDKETYLEICEKKFAYFE